MKHYNEPKCHNYTSRKKFYKQMEELLKQGGKRFFYQEIDHTGHDHSYCIIIIQSNIRDGIMFAHVFDRTLMTYCGPFIQYGECYTVLPIDMQHNIDEAFAMFKKMTA